MFVQLIEFNFTQSKRELGNKTYFFTLLYYITFIILFYASNGDAIYESLNYTLYLDEYKCILNPIEFLFTQK